jgi:CheY-like chemotaxis protein
VNNAVKFTRSGQVMIDISPVSLNDLKENSCECDSFGVQVLVQDTGIGIPTDKLDMMFECFTLAEDYLSHTTGGLGLGLAIVNRLVTLLGGFIRCTSQEGTGSTFSIVIPLNTSSYVQQTPLNAVMAEEKPLNGARVLVAEDDLVSQRYITRLLEKMGASVRLVEDGLQAVDALKVELFDIVLMDVEMPIMNGIEATRAIRERASGCLFPDIPIIALTAHAMWGDEQRCLHAGMDDYVTKPVDIDTVAAIIQSTLDKQIKNT